jgi:DnaK suppressor protein
MSTPQQSGRIKNALLTRRERFQQDLQRHNDPLVADAPDRAVQVQNDATLQVIDEATTDELATVEEALQRLDQGLYGICKECGGEIEAVRLQMLHAVTCSYCARG